MGKFSPEQVHIELKYELWGIFLCVSGIFILLSLMGLNTGPVGAFVVRVVRYACGIGALPVPLLMLIIGIRYTAVRKPLVFTLRFVGFILAYLTALAVVHLTVPPYAEILPENLPAAGGLIGGLLLFAIRKAFGLVGAMVVLVLLALYALVLSTGFSFAPLLLWLKEKGQSGWQDARAGWYNALDRLTESETAATVVPPQAPSFYDQAKDLPAPPARPAPAEPPASSASTDAAEMHTAPVVLPAPACGNYQLPPYSLLAHSRRSRTTHGQKETADNVKLLEETLESFGVGAKVVNISYGPAITRYEVQPAPGVKVSKIVNLADDIALKLAATGVRIEAPIPGKAAVGIEVPNKAITTVPLADTLDSDAFRRATSALTVGLGKDIAGQVVVTDLAKMPHLLVAGATGSGKSVCINTIIASILFKARPETVKFLLIDPKVVELSVYNGIPHLLTPVVTDPKKAAAALRWAVQEMERRYNLFAAAGVREISRYNEMGDAPLPLIVIIIDELADLMMVAPVDVEDAICRLAQMARAAGLHLVLATQRPSVDVITGTIKANIPSRIAFAVSSQVDSRTILDMAGAEKLLGKGDMLFFPVGVPKPIRVQGAFISDDEVEKLVRYVQQQAEPEYTAGVTTYEVAADGEQGAETTSRDELLEEAVRLVLEAGQASVSMLQRKFRIGYTRAARLIDTMEEMKIIGPNVGSKAREIIMTSDQVNAKYFHNK